MEIVACVCESYGTDDALPSSVFSYLSEVILPSLCLSEPRFTLNVKLWSILRALPVQRRHLLYTSFFYVGRFTHAKVVAAAAVIRRTIGREMKRMTAEQSDVGHIGTLYTSLMGGESVFGHLIVKAQIQSTQRERVVVDTLTKLCSSNPFEVG